MKHLDEDKPYLESESWAGRQKERMLVKEREVRDCSESLGRRALPCR